MVVMTLTGTTRIIAVLTAATIKIRTRVIIAGAVMSRTSAVVLRNTLTAAQVTVVSYLTKINKEDYQTKAETGNLKVECQMTGIKISGIKMSGTKQAAVISKYLTIIGMAINLKEATFL